MRWVSDGGATIGLRDADRVGGWGMCLRLRRSGFDGAEGVRVSPLPCHRIARLECRVSGSKAMIGFVCCRHRVVLYLDYLTHESPGLPVWWRSGACMHASSDVRCHVVRIFLS